MLSMALRLSFVYPLPVWRPPPDYPLAVPWPGSQGPVTAAREANRPGLRRWLALQRAQPG